MSRIPSIAITTGLIGSGVLAWAFAGRPLLANPDLRSPLNPLGINHSPYGEVFAMALQGPIETEFHMGMFGSASHKHAEESTNEVLLAPQPEQSSTDFNLSLADRLRTMLASMEKGIEERTNPRPASDALKLYLRRQAEDKLRFAYQLDPSHYANYNSLHFFLIEGVGTRPELTPSAGKLAEETIQYCLKQENDPRPALTAASACTNILHLMFADQHEESPKFTTEQMRQCLNVLDQCLARYEMVSKQWDESDNWELLSTHRITECQDRFSFISKIRDAAEKTILRFEEESEQHQALN